MPPASDDPTRAQPLLNRRVAVAERRPHRRAPGVECAHAIGSRRGDQWIGGNDFDAPNHVRLSYATSREKINQAFDRIERLAREIMR